jgi:hypothetical protein
MAIVDLTTNLKSLRYGKDRPFGGSSNQPYVTRDIDVKDSEVGRTGGPDFLLRGGTLVPQRVKNDVSRITQMLFDFKSPNGPLFIAKQNVLSLTSNNFKAGFETLSLRKRQEGLSSIAKDIDSIGTFVSNNIGFDKNNVYNPLSTIAQTAGGFLGLHLEKQGLLPPIQGPSRYLDFIVDGSDKKSRLINLAGGKLTTSDTTLYQYIGGPGSINGVGRTQVKRYENTNLQEKGFLNYETLSSVGGKLENDPNAIIDFRQEPGGSKVKTLNYSRPENRIEQRVRLGNPGKRGIKRENYQIGLGEALDKINALSLYKGEYQLGADKGNDFVKFRIGVIDSGEPNKKTFIHFRAFLDSFSDSYNAEWNTEKFMGRGENFYRYNGFTRTINLSWTVAAQSKQELIPMHQKLNYLASSLTPYYSDIGYMGGNLVSLTLGGYLYEQPGIITSMTLDVPQESPWEIGIPVSGGEEKDVKELPHIIKVTNVQFIPIHNFVPQLQQNKYNGPGAGIESKYLSSFGKERYIALSTGAPDGNGGGGNNNYGTEDGSPVNGAHNYIQLSPTNNKTVSTIKTQPIQTNKITAPILTNE